MTAERKHEMGPWRQRLWPIYADEMKKFLPMVIIMFWVLFNYTLVRNVKDSLIVNAPHAGGSVLPWLKVMWVTPLSIAFVIGYAKLSNILSKERLYYTILIPFIIFFGIFGLFIYPNNEWLNASPETVLAWKEGWAALPVLKGLRDFLPTVGYWSFSMFYVMAELWGNVGAAILFWQFANQITPTAEAKRFYPMFGFWANLGLVCAGLLTIHSESILRPQLLASGAKDFSQQIMLYSFFLVLGGVIIALAYWWMGKNVLTDPKYYDEAALTKKGKAPKPKMSIGESMAFLMKSKYLWYIAILVLAYGVTINIVEVMWKERVGVMFMRDKSAYSAYIGHIFIWTGIVTMFFIMVSKNLIQSMGWLFSASLTPWVVLITGGGFFLFILAGDSMAGVCAMLGTTPLLAAVFLGSAQNIISKGVKYSLFDPTKEMAYIPLDEESKVKGKAAIDVIFGRMGKAGGSFIQMGLPFMFSSQDAIMSCLAGILVSLSFVWLWAVGNLNTLYTAKLAEKEEK